MGKHRPEYTPHVDTGDFVVVTNATKVGLTGNKASQKLKLRYSGYPGGQKARTYGHVREHRPEELVEDAVKRMLPKSRLGRQMLKKLKVYPGAEHPHDSHKPDSPARLTPPPAGAADSDPRITNTRASRDPQAKELSRPHAGRSEEHHGRPRLPDHDHQPRPRRRERRPAPPQRGRTRPARAQARRQARLVVGRRPAQGRRRPRAPPPREGRRRQGQVQIQVNRKTFKTIENYFSEQQDRNDAYAPLTLDRHRASSRSSSACTAAASPGRPRPSASASPAPSSATTPTSRAPSASAGLPHPRRPKVERKKYGQPGARRRFQFSKR
jgi:large subunit ribosomal protein L13